MSQWIKCRDRLPCIGVPVIIFVRGRVRMAVIFEHPNCRDNFFWNIWTGNEFEVEEAMRVPRWMPLPPPPEAMA